MDITAKYTLVTNRLGGRHYTLEIFKKGKRAERAMGFDYKKEAVAFFKKYKENKITKQGELRRISIGRGKAYLF